MEDQFWILNQQLESLVRRKEEQVMRKEEQIRRQKEQPEERDKKYKETMEMLRTYIAQLQGGPELVHPQSPTDGRSTSELGNNSSTKSLSFNPQLEIPRFDGFNARAWLNKCEKYFELCKTPDKQKVDIASSHMTGKAEHWMCSYLCIGRFVCWSEFTVDVIGKFGDETCVDRILKSDIENDVLKGRNQQLETAKMSVTMTPKPFDESPKKEKLEVEVGSLAEQLFAFPHTIRYKSFDEKFYGRWNASENSWLRSIKNVPKFKKKKSVVKTQPQKKEVVLGPASPTLSGHKRKHKDLEPEAHEPPVLMPPPNSMPYTIPQYDLKPFDQEGKGGLSLENELKDEIGTINVSDNEDFDFGDKGEGAFDTLGELLVDVDGVSDVIEVPPDPPDPLYHRTYIIGVEDFRIRGYPFCLSNYYHKRCLTVEQIDLDGIKIEHASKEIGDVCVDVKFVCTEVGGYSGEVISDNMYSLRRVLKSSKSITEAVKEEVAESNIVDISSLVVKLEYNVVEKAVVESVTVTIQKSIASSSSTANSLVFQYCKGVLLDLGDCRRKPLCVSCMVMKGLQFSSPQQSDTADSGKSPERKTNGNLSRSKGKGRLTRKELRMHRNGFVELADGAEVAYFVGKKGSGIFCFCYKKEDWAVTSSLNREYSAAENDDLFSVCADGGNLLCCDTCRRAYHTECLSLPVILEGKFHFKYCKNTFEKEKIVEMRQNNVEQKCNWNTYSTLASAYVKAGLYDKAELALKVLEGEINKMGRPDRQPFHYLLTLYAGMSNLREVHSIWECLKSTFECTTNARVGEKNVFIFDPGEGTFAADESTGTTKVSSGDLNHAAAISHYGIENEGHVSAVGIEVPPKECLKMKTLKEYEKQKADKAALSVPETNMRKATLEKDLESMLVLSKEKIDNIYSKQNPKGKPFRKDNNINNDGKVHKTTSIEEFRKLTSGSERQVVKQYFVDVVATVPQKVVVHKDLIQEGGGAALVHLSTFGLTFDPGGSAIFSVLMITVQSAEKFPDFWLFDMCKLGDKFGVKGGVLLWYVLTCDIYIYRWAWCAGILVCCMACMMIKSCDLRCCALLLLYYSTCGLGMDLISTGLVDIGPCIGIRINTEL